MRVADHIVAVVLALGLAPLAGCMALTTAEPPPCSDSLDCPDGQICEPNSHTCVVPGFDSIVDFELTPDKGTASAPTQVPGVDLKKSLGFIELELNKAVPLTGLVSSPLGVPGSLVVSRDPEFDARSLSWNFQVGDDGYFEAQVAYKQTENGEPDPHFNTYRATFRPSNRQDFPQLEVTGLVVGELGLDQELAYPDYRQPAEPLEVRLRVLQSEGYPHPVTGIQVEALTDQGLRTNLVTPDDQGYASLRLPVTRRLDQGGELLLPERLDLTIRPAEASIRLPTVKVTDLDLSATDDLGTFYLGDVPESHGLTGVVVNRSGHPVPDCLLHFTAGGIGNGSFEKTLQADSEGAFSTTLPAGRYQVLAVPGLSDSVGLGGEIIDVGPDMDPLTVILDPRLAIRGRMRDPDGQPLAEVIVLAERTADWFGQDDGVARTFQGASDDQGDFELLVDPGIYDLTFIPLPASGLPRLIYEDIIMLDRDEDLPASATRLPAPEVIEGHVFNAGGSPVCGVTVDVYRSDDTSATLIGQTVSSGDQRSCSGAYQVVVPAAAP